MFSKACEYGIKATLFVAQRSLQQERVSLKAISAEIDSPEAFTAKILQQLAKSGILRSTKGPSGGFQVEPEALAELKLSAIVKSIDGDAIYVGCGLGLNECDAKHPCPMHDHFVQIRNDLQRMLETTSIHSLAMDIAEGGSVLKR